MKINISKSDMIVIVTICAYILVFILFAPSFSEDRADIIRRELQEQGYDVESVQFEFVEKGDRANQEIYRSSQPIEYQGEPVSLWVLSRFTMMPSAPYVTYEVEPLQ